MEITDIRNVATRIESFLDGIQAGDSNNYSLALRYVKAQIEVKPKNIELAAALEKILLAEINEIGRKANHPSFSFEAPVREGQYFYCI